MHSELDIRIEQLTKIEGHVNVDVKVRAGKVEYVRLKISENKRFYTQAIRGRSFSAAPQLMSRICGTCSIAHLLCCIGAVEDALKLEVSAQTKILRLLSMYGMYIRDHALHLYLFALPDVLGKDSLLELDENKPEERQWLDEAFAVKGAGNRLSQLIAGRAVHSPFPVVGGHLKFPDESSVAGILAELKRVRPMVFHVIDAFRDCLFVYDRKTDFIAIDGEGFLPFGGEVKSSRGRGLSSRQYFQHLEKVVIPYSQAMGYSFEGKDYMVGSLARINLNSGKLHPSTLRDCASYLKLFPSKNIYHNNLAQAIETVHAIDHSIELLENTKFVQESRAPVAARACEGTAAVEAPRGILYYRVRMDEKGVIDDATVVVPTQQNQINMERDIKDIVESNLSMDKDFITAEIEKLLRAYDPCMSCASHFLRINWV
ncbi:nickel-dependent hydrogenase large subunit [Candidatus Woesearchaeota archaeon]|nr:nickel-dependent hydrogenase large subunit [Candidatus Woesearchaeota archaeon]